MKKKRGGARPGSGRPKGISTKILERQSSASDMLKKLGGAATWQWAMKKARKNEDYRTVTEIMRYWTDRALGKAPQAITINDSEPIRVIFKRDPETPAVDLPAKPS